MKSSIATDIAAVQSISAVPSILKAVAEMTALRFVCVARVDADSWTACAVLDQLNFGLEPGGGLDVATTLCSEVRDARIAIVIDNVPEDSLYCNHHTPRMYGFASYISVPIFRPDGEYFGTLCGLDPLPLPLSEARVLRTMELFCELISLQLDREATHAAREVALRSEQETAALREQFIAVLGHDLRTPLASILGGSELLLRQPLAAPQSDLVRRIQRSGERIRRLADDLLDFARGRMGGGMQVRMRAAPDLEDDLRHVVAELQSVFTDRQIHASLAIPADICCEAERIAQMLSNLLVNALIHGAPDKPVEVSAGCRDGLFIITVHNQGKPIPAEAMARLFEPYWRGAEQRREDGIGLGLYIAHEIARSHGGNLEVRSIEGEGTRFRFSMPSPGGTSDGA
jgi:signal transduction histidine kinase